MLKRTHRCDEVTVVLQNQKIVLNGWVDRVRNLGGVLFVTLRDRYGKVQILFDPAEGALFTKAASLHGEDVIAVKGVIQKRPLDAVKEENSGAVEVKAEELEVFSNALTPPFYIHVESDVNEEVRLTYRYLDLRRQRMQRNIALRHTVVQKTREYFNALSFLEIETPILTKSTPEGARDFLVPSRLKPGKFYALPQSPQLFKQLLMVSGFDRYYQIAKCFRDEDFRADRQPEFTQIDYEMSFVEQEDVMAITEGLLKTIFQKTLAIDVPTPLRVMDYEYAIDHYGTDKPDLRFDLQFCDLTRAMERITFEPIQKSIAAGGVVKGFKIPGVARTYSRKVFGELEEKAKAVGAKGLLNVRIQDGERKASFDKYLPEQDMVSLVTLLNLQEGDVGLIISGEKKEVNLALGALRLEIAKREGYQKKGNYQFLWVVRFPMFSYSQEEKRYVAEHHPFTMPEVEELEAFGATHPQKIHAHAYDVVLNGWEIGGGSVRIHSRAIQKTVFNILGIEEEAQQKKFGFLLDAFQYGVPPHAGCALGLDRLVALIAGEDYIRDVIPFPKTTTGSCQMTNAPSEVDGEQLDKLSIRILKEQH